MSKSNQKKFNTMFDRLKHLGVTITKAKRNGIKLVRGQWGVEYDLETKTWRTTNGCACAFGACLVVDNPQPPESVLKNYVNSDDDFTVGTVDDEMVMIGTIMKYLGFTEKQIAVFIESFDEPNGNKDLVRKSVVRQAAVKLAKRADA